MFTAGSCPVRSHPSTAGHLSSSTGASVGSRSCVIILCVVNTESFSARLQIWTGNFPIAEGNVSWEHSSTLYCSVSWQKKETKLCKDQVVADNTLHFILWSLPVHRLYRFLSWLHRCHWLYSVLAKYTKIIASDFAQALYFEFKRALVSRIIVATFCPIVNVAALMCARLLANYPKASIEISMQMTKGSTWL